MQVSLETIDGLKRRLTITVPADRVQIEYNNRVKTISKTARIDGFRPGKVPTSLIEKRYADSIIYEVADVLVRESLDKAIEEKALKVAGMPKIDFAEAKPAKGQPLVYKAEVEVFPEIKLATLTGVALTKEVAQVQAKDVDNTLEKLRHQQAEFKETELPAKDGDRLTIDYEGKMNAELFEGGSANAQSIVIGSKTMIPGFEEGLIGLKKGDHKTLSLKFPEKYHNEACAGKPVEFAVTVKDVFSAILPEINEAFLSKFKVDSLDKLKEEIQQNLSRNCEQAIKAKLKNKLVDKLLELNSFDIPGNLVEGEIRRLKQQAIQRMGVKKQEEQEAFLKYLPDDMFIEQAKKDVKLGLLFSEMIKERNLKADPDDVRKHIEKMAASYEQPEQAISWYYSQKNILQEIEFTVLEETLIDAILEGISVKEETVEYEELIKQ